MKKVLAVCLLGVSAAVLSVTALNLDSSHLVARMFEQTDNRFDVQLHADPFSGMPHLTLNAPWETFLFAHH